MVFLGVQLLVNYGWGIFIALPFVMGFVAAVIYGLRHPRSRSECIIVASLTMAVLGAALLAFAVEGLICLIMAVPIALPLAAFGTRSGQTQQEEINVSTKRIIGALSSIGLLGSAGGLTRVAVVAGAQGRACD